MHTTIEAVVTVLEDEEESKVLYGKVLITSRGTLSVPGHSASQLVTHAVHSNHSERPLMCIGGVQRYPGEEEEPKAPCTGSITYICQ